MEIIEESKDAANADIRQSTHHLVEMVLEASEYSEDEWEVADLVQEWILVEGVSPGLAFAR